MQHGWQYKLELAYAPSSAGRDDFRHNAEAAWIKALRERKGKHPTYPMKIAAVDTAAADLIDWLASNRSVTNNVQAIGNALTGEAMSDLATNLGLDGLKKFKAASVNHFWCELLASLACAVKQLEDWRDEVTERLKPIMTASNFSADIEDTAVGSAVEAAWSAISHALPLGQLSGIGEALWPVRILAILMCKAPERHKNVSKCCLDPIAQGANETVRTTVAQVTKERLTETLPADWLPATQKLLSE
ncbi:hypothetical protein ACH35V_25575 [Actinomadura sp. 1N219]|uniref:hypothetical protein n=1 Tax=Actinomadura sp. 1N219 TaxID=3375152 RepID=UPI00378AA01F